jgi:hypothetical protein
MMRKIRLELLTVCIIATIMTWRGCAKPTHTDVPSRTLPTSLSRQVLRGNDLITTYERTDEDIPSAPSKPYVSPEAKITVKDPTILKVVDYGFIFKPGVQAVFPIGAGFDVKLAFYHRYGAGLVGLYGFSDKKAELGIFASRHFSRLDNLETVVGITTAKRPYIGLRLSL